MDNVQNILCCLGNGVIDDYIIIVLYKFHFFQCAVDTAVDGFFILCAAVC